MAPDRTTTWTRPDGVIADARHHRPAADRLSIGSQRRHIQQATVLRGPCARPLVGNDHRGGPCRNSDSDTAQPSAPARPDHRRARAGSDRAGRPRAARRRRHGFHPDERRRSPARRTVRPRGRRERPQRVRRRSGAVADHRVVARHRGRRQWRGLRVHRRPVRVAVEHPAVEQQLDGRRILRDGGRRRRRHSGVAARPRRLGRRRDGESRRAHVGVRRRPRGALRHRRERGLRRVVGRVADSRRCSVAA